MSNLGVEAYSYIPKQTLLPYSHLKYWFAASLYKGTELNSCSYHQKAQPPCLYQKKNKAVLYIFLPQASNTWNPNSAGGDYYQAAAELYW